MCEVFHTIHNTIRSRLLNFHQTNTSESVIDYRHRIRHLRPVLLRSFHLTWNDFGRVCSARMHLRLHYSSARMHFRLQYSSARMHFRFQHFSARMHFRLHNSVLELLTRNFVPASSARLSTSFRIRTYSSQFSRRISGD